MLPVREVPDPSSAAREVEGGFAASSFILASSRLRVSPVPAQHARQVSIPRHAPPVLTRAPVALAAVGEGEGVDLGLAAVLAAAVGAPGAVVLGLHRAGPFGLPATGAGLRGAGLGDGKCRTARLPKG